MPNLNPEPDYALVLLHALILLNTALHGQIITTVAGNSTFGYSGDGGPALNAQLSDMYYTYPAFDHAGNMYIVQSEVIPSGK